MLISGIKGGQCLMPVKLPLQIILSTRISLAPQGGLIPRALVSHAAWGDKDTPTLGPGGDKDHTAGRRLAHPDEVGRGAGPGKDENSTPDLYHSEADLHHLLSSAVSCPPSPPPFRFRTLPATVPHSGSKPTPRRWTGTLTHIVEERVPQVEIDLCVPSESYWGIACDVSHAHKERASTSIRQHTPPLHGSS